MLSLVGSFKSDTDGTIKNVFKNELGEIIEVSLLMNKEYDVLCVPSHHYCNLGCKMCHLTDDRVNKKMTPVTNDELMEAFYKTVVVDNKRITSKNRLLLSFMGVGEPLLNFKLVEDMYLDEINLKALGYLDVAYSISTMMPSKELPNIQKRVNELNMPLKIHFSLHSPDNDKRSELLPSSKVSVEEGLKYLSDYSKLVMSNPKIVKRYSNFHKYLNPTEIHYTLIDGVNDSSEELSMLSDLLKEYMIPIKFIRFNPKENMNISNLEYNWVQILKGDIPDLRVKQYTPPGREVGSSCGDFTKHYYLEEVETEKDKKDFIDWEKKYTLNRH